MTVYEAETHELETRRSATSNAAVSRLPYHPPTLRDHGDIRELTGGLGGDPTDGATTPYEGDDTTYNGFS